MTDKTNLPPSFAKHASNFTGKERPMRPNTMDMNYQCLLQITPDTTDLELAVMSWFAAGHEILWIPIYEVADEPNGIADAEAEMAHFGGLRFVDNVTDFFALPIGIKGWLFPAHLDDTDVICLRELPREVSLGHLYHPVTGERITYRYPTEAPVRRQAFYYGAMRKV